MRSVDNNQTQRQEHQRADGHRGATPAPRDARWSGLRPLMASVRRGGDWRGGRVGGRSIVLTSMNCSSLVTCGKQLTRLYSLLLREQRSKAAGTHTYSTDNLASLLNAVSSVLRPV